MGVGAVFREQELTLDRVSTRSSSAWESLAVLINLCTILFVKGWSRDSYRRLYLHFNHFNHTF
jgi:hypothetical protein